MADNVHIRKGADSIFIDWPEKSQNLIFIFFSLKAFPKSHYQTRASLRRLILMYFIRNNNSNWFQQIKVELRCIRRP